MLIVVGPIKEKNLESEIETWRAMPMAQVLRAIKEKNLFESEIETTHPVMKERTKHTDQREESRVRD